MNATHVIVFVVVEDSAMVNVIIISADWCAHNSLMKRFLIASCASIGANNNKLSLSTNFDKNESNRINDNIYYVQCLECAKPELWLDVDEGKFVL